jgi:hypothetical protein
MMKQIFSFDDNTTETLIFKKKKKEKKIGMTVEEDFQLF